MAEGKNDWNGSEWKLDQINRTGAKDTKKKKDAEKEKKERCETITIQLKDPYRKIEYALYQPGEEEAYRPLQGARIASEMLKKTKQKWKLKEVEEDRSEKQFRLGVWSFFHFPKGGSDECQTARAKLQMILLLGQISSILVSDFTLPVVYLGEGSKEIYDAVEALLITVQGHGRWEGEECQLIRKWLIRPVVADKSSQISRQTEDYIRGWIGPDEDGNCFWVGYAESVVAIKADVDEKVQNEIIKTSEFMIPILFEKSGRKKAGRTEIYIPSNCLSGWPVKIQSMRALGISLHECIKPFIKEFHENKKIKYNEKDERRQERWEKRIELYRPSRNQENQEQSDAEEDLYCAALAFLEQLLEYLEFRKMITREDVDRVLLDYCKWVLPDSPQMYFLESELLKSKPWRTASLMDPIEQMEAKKYNDLDLFFAFLREYAFGLKSKCEKKKHGSPVSRGIIHTLKKKRRSILLLREISCWMHIRSGSMIIGFNCFPLKIV